MTRVMQGVANLEGRTVGTLKVGAMVSRWPSPRYATVCAQCGTAGTESQLRLTSGTPRCLHAGCGKDAIRETISDTPTKARRREESAENAKRREAEQQRDAEIKKLESSLVENSAKVAQLIRERITKIADEECWIDPTTIGIVLTPAEAAKFNNEQAELFAKSTPEYYATPANAKAISSYLDLNKIRIVSALTLRAAFERLDSVGLIEHIPEQTPVQQPDTKPAPSKVNLSFESEAPKAPTGPETFVGVDPSTGREREYTQREVGRMSSDEFRRAFKLYRAELAVSNVAGS